MTRIIKTVKGMLTTQHTYAVEVVNSPVLTARCAMQVNDELQVVVRCPSDGLLQIV
jgi:hypothetical protein